MLVPKLQLFVRRMSYTSMGPFGGNGKEVSRLCKQGQFQAAQELFRKKPDAGGAAAIIGGCTRDSNGIRIATETFQLLCKHVPPDLVIFTSLINKYRQCGHPELAVSLLESIQKYYIPPTLKLFGALIMAALESHTPHKALELGEQLKKYHLSPDPHIYCLLFRACADLSYLEKGQQLRKDMEHSNIIRDPHTESSLINMYGKCGDSAEAMAVFRRLPKLGIHPNIVVWGAIIDALSINGRGKEALKLLDEMTATHLKPNGVILLSLLNGCSHAGLVQEAVELFAKFSKSDLISTTAHLNCFIDTLARSGRIEEAVKVATQAPKPDVITWSSILSACVSYNNVQQGEIAFANARKIEPGDPSHYSQMAAIYAHNKQWEKRNKVYKMINDLGLRKIPGESSITINGVLHTFVMDDCTHPQIGAIQKTLKKLRQKIEKAGYKGDTTGVQQAPNKSESEKADSLWLHSERLAIGLGLAITPPKTPLRLIENLRVCRDCHEITKLISKVTKREIFVRDANRVHRFINGKCSCGDYY